MVCRSQWVRLLREQWLCARERPFLLSPIARCDTDSDGSGSPVALACMSQRVAGRARVSRLGV